MIKWFWIFSTVFILLLVMVSTRAIRRSKSIDDFMLAGSNIGAILGVLTYAAALDPNYVGAINNLGIIYFERGDVDKGILMVEKALQIQPESIDGYLNLGTFYKHKRSYKKSAHYFDEGLKRAPTEYRIAYQLAWLYSACPLASLRNGKQAVRLAEFVCETQDYNHAPSLDLLAAAYAEDGQFRRAVETGQKASQLARTNGQPKLMDDINNRIELYRNNKAFREN